MNFKNNIFIYRIIKSIISVFHLIYSYKRSQTLKQITDKIYSFWISNNIRSCGITSKVSYDCNLIGGEYIEIGEYTKIARHSIINCRKVAIEDGKIPMIRIGNNCTLGEYCHITSINSIIIGNGVLTGRRVLISDNSHGNFSFNELNELPTNRSIVSKGSVYIGDNVWIGDNVCILSDVKIGTGSIIAANAVVTKNIPEYSLAVGVPARVIKSLD